MADGVLTAAALAAIYLSFALLALSQEGHWAAVAGAGSASAASLRRARRGGAAGLALGCMLCLAGNGAAFGTLLAVLLLGAGAMGVAFTLAWKPRWLRAVARMLEA